MICRMGMHVKCAFASRGQSERVNRDEWKCEKCVTELMMVPRPREECVTANDALDCLGSDGCVRIGQWNADHIRSKLPELTTWLLEHRVDVAMVQESKLRAEDGKISVPGYDVVRKDRVRSKLPGWARGGGLVVLVRSDWSYVELDSGLMRDCPLEVLWVDVIDGDGRVWHCINVYAPPANSASVDLEVLSKLPSMHSGRWVVAGDWNAHDRCWDLVSAPDARGGMLMEWADDVGLTVANDGGVTRVERGTSRHSTPDVTLTSRGLRDRCTWEVKHQLGSDHWPILIEVGGGHTPTGGKSSLVWNWKKADWEGYRTSLMRVYEQYDWESLSVQNVERLLRVHILEAANEYVGRKKVGGGAEATLSQEVREAVEDRDKLKEAASLSRMV